MKPAIKKIVLEMLDILGGNADIDERQLAVGTLREALFPYKEKPVNKFKPGDIVLSSSIGDGYQFFNVVISKYKNKYYCGTDHHYGWYEEKYLKKCTIEEAVIATTVPEWNTNRRIALSNIKNTIDWFMKTDSKVLRKNLKSIAEQLVNYS